jgi:hypothetical protein
MSKPCLKCKELIEINESVKGKIKLLKDNHHKLTGKMREMESIILKLNKEIKDLKESLDEK